MPVCKNCKSRIDKFNKDRCPICGVEHPFEGVTSDTIEITTSLDVDDMNYKPRKKKMVLIYSICLGFFGIEFFYLYLKKFAVVALIFNLAMIGGVGTVVGLFTALGIGGGIGVMVAAMLLVNTLLGLYFFKKPNLKDGHNEFVI